MANSSVRTARVRQCFRRLMHRSTVFRSVAASVSKPARAAEALAGRSLPALLHGQRAA